MVGRSGADSDHLYGSCCHARIQRGASLGVIDGVIDMDERRDIWMLYTSIGAANAQHCR